MILAVGVVVLCLFAAVTQAAKGSAGLYVGIAAVMLGPGLAIGGASLWLFGARARIRNAFALAGFGVGVMMVPLFLFSGHTAILHAPRLLMLGSARGTVAEISARDAAWVDITPAYIDTSRSGRATHTSTDKDGHTTTRHAVVLPIVAAQGEADRAVALRQPVLVFACDTEIDDLEGDMNGTVSGRMYAADFLEIQAIERIPDLVRAAGDPMCVRPGSSAGTLWTILWVLLVVAVATGATAIVLALRAPER